jgi:basic membrane lipoprotein Med (substrate-binding protein (PBP1-ABC) superfamily)
VKSSITRAEFLRLFGATLFAAGTSSLSGCGSRTNDTNRLKIAFLTNGPINDFGYNSAHERARLDVQNALDDRVETQMVENVPETADASRVMERLVQAGNRLIIPTSFGYQDAAFDLAGRSPNVQFLQAWGFKQHPNMGSYSAKMYEAWYVCGVVAGLVSQSGKLGIVAAHPIPPMRWQINAFVLGARSVNPAITAQVIFINHWFDATLASEATTTLIQQGADVVTGVLDSSRAVAQTAEARGAYLIGHNADLSQFAPNRILTGTEWLWGKLYTEVVRAVLNGTNLNGKHYSGGLREGYVGYREFSSRVPQAARAAATEAANRIRSGALAVYAGPISDNAGRVRVPAGTTLTHDQIMGIDWAVQGVSGQ